MKRIIILIDGTWNLEAKNANTNVALLDPNNETLVGPPLIMAQGSDNITQIVAYHCGVGADQNGLQRWLAGAIGVGLKQLVLDAYASLAKHYEHGDEVTILGFSRGAYAARALAGLIGASGIVQTPSEPNKEAAWTNYRTKPADRPATGNSIAAAVHTQNTIKCIGVWETVGSYGIPAGFGFAALARYIAWASLGFHDTSFGNHIEFGLHALGVDERRRPFVPTFWTIPKGQKPQGQVEQTWFAGDHGGVGGGHLDVGLSIEALIWMIARLQVLAGVQFDAAVLKEIVKNANIDGEVYDSTVGWPVDHLSPHLRTVLSPDAIDHGALLNTDNPGEEHINERVHWSLIQKHKRPCKVFGAAGVPYSPNNYPPTILPDKIAGITAEESAIYALREMPTP